MGRSEKPGEFDLIERVFAPLAATPAARGLIDDAAVLAADGGRETVVTTDTLIEGVHFPIGEDAELVAGRLLVVNLSDLAAMGADPCAYTLSLALPTDWTMAWIERFADGLRQAQTAHGIQLIGGDTVATPGPTTLTVTALGHVEPGRAIGRGGAQPGDRVYVSGTIGDAALGLRLIEGKLTGLADSDAAHLIKRFQRPVPRLALGRRLVGLAHAAIDISDGLVADFSHLARASGCAAVLEADTVPLSAAARAALDSDAGLRDPVLTGGDDYELLFAVPPNGEEALGAVARDIGVPLTAIGRIENSGEPATGVRVIDGAGNEIAVGTGGFRHF